MLYFEYYFDNDYFDFKSFIDSSIKFNEWTTQVEHFQTKTLSTRESEIGYFFGLVQRSVDASYLFGIKIQKPLHNSFH